MRVIKFGVPALALWLITSFVVSTGSAEDDQSWQDKSGSERFAPLHWLVGEWRGYGEFAKDTGYIHKRFYYDLAGMYLIERTLDMFPPKEPTTEFEIHQDFVVYSRGNESGALKARGFFVESFVTSAQVSVSADGNSVVIESIEIENGPPGMRTRFTISRQTKDQYKESFEIAMPGKDYSIVEELTMTRVK